MGKRHFRILAAPVFCFAVFIAGCNNSDRDHLARAAGKAIPNELVVTLKAPTNANSFSFDFQFFSAEYPQYVCTEFNDEFLVMQESQSEFGGMLTVGWTPDLASVVWLGGTLGKNDTMCNCNSDAVYVAAPAWHKFMETALKTVPDTWYQPPSDVVKGANNSWFLVDAPRVDHLPNDNPIASPGPNYGVPSDPGTGPVKAGAQPGAPLPLPWPLPPQQQPGGIRPVPPPQP